MNLCALPALFRSMPTWQPPVSATNPWLAPVAMPLDSFAPSPGLGYVLANEELAAGWLSMAGPNGPAASLGVNDYLAAAWLLTALGPAAQTARVKTHASESRPNRLETHATTEAHRSSDLGLKATGYNASKAGGWGGWCLSYVRNAVEWAAGKKDHGIPLLNAGSAEEARQKAERAGLLRQGNPPPGAIIFFKPGTYGMNSQYGHIAIANPDGESFHGSSSSLRGNEVGSMRYPRGAKANVYWTMPEWLIKGGK